MTDRKIAEAFPPGDFIKEELDARGWSQIELAEILGRPARLISELASGKRSVTPETAKGLGDAFGTGAQYWMNLESSYQLWRTAGTDQTVTRRSRLYQMAPIKEMTKRHWIESSENVDILEKRVLDFFGMPTVDGIPYPFPHAARNGTSYFQELTPSHLAWLHRAKQLSTLTKADTFTQRSLDHCLLRLKELMGDIDRVRDIPGVLAEAGIRFLVLEHLPQTRIDGVTFWLNSKAPVIVISLRYDRIDSFWYTFAHELGHVKHRDGLEHPVFVDSDIMMDHNAVNQKPELELRADRFAEQFLISPSEIEPFMNRTRPSYNKKRIRSFAKQIGVHPGIVVGQLQHRQEIQWSYYRQSLCKIRHVIAQSALTDGWGQVPHV